jgi:signal transduction histidine kinase
MIRIEVEDNGIGIKPEHFQTIFAMFRRLHTKDQYEGTGTGLAVCKRIVEEHQGEIGVNSTFGKGTIFWFTLPFRQNVDSKQSSKIMSGDI